MSLIQMSVSGACIIFATIVIRALAIHRLPKRTFLILWGIALARLVLPFSIPSPFGVSALIRRGAPAVAAALEPAVSREAQLISGINRATVRNLPALPAATRPGVPLWTIVWLAGAAVCAMLFAASYIRWYRAFRRSTPVDNAFTREWLKKHALRRTISIRQSSCISAPLTYGVIRPVILVPERLNWEETERLNCVFTHEFTHIRRFDALSKLALAAAPCIHWFNPLVWAMYVLANRDIELACDEAVIRAIGAKAKKSYAFALLDLEERRSGLAVLTNGFSRNAIEERINAIMKMKRVTLPAILLAALLVTGMTAAFATSAPAEIAAESKPAPPAQFGVIQEPGATADYSIYEPYGLRYDAENDCYTYNGSVVAFFNDPIAGASFTNFFSGTVELEAVYDADSELVGIAECSEEVYAQHADKRARFGRIVNSEEAVEQGTTPPAELDWLREYEIFGISYDARRHSCLYLGQTVKTLVDLGTESVYTTGEGDICLSIQRNATGAVCAIDECTEEQAQALMAAMDPQGSDLAVEAAFDLDEAVMSETAIRRLAQRYPELEEWIRTQYPNTVWWTVEGYSAWMQHQLAVSRSLLGQTIGSNSSGTVVVTQESIDEEAAEYQATLRLLKDGWMISNCLDGNENLGGGFDPADVANGRAQEFELSVLLNDGTEAHFGPFETADELLVEFLPFSEAQVASGNLDSGEAEEIIKHYEGK